MIAPEFLGHEGCGCVKGQGGGEEECWMSWKNQVAGNEKVGAQREDKRGVKVVRQ